MQVTYPALFRRSRFNQSLAPYLGFVTAGLKVCISAIDWGAIAQVKVFGTANPLAITNS
jgi:hypothetical protein